MNTSLTRLPHRFAHAFFLEIVYAYAFHSRVDLRHALLRARGAAPPAPRTCEGTGAIRNEGYEFATT